MAFRLLTILSGAKRREHLPRHLTRVGMAMVMEPRRQRTATPCRDGIDDCLGTTGSKIV